MPESNHSMESSPVPMVVVKQQQQQQQQDIDNSGSMSPSMTNDVYTHHEHISSVRESQSLPMSSNSAVLAPPRTLSPQSSDSGQNTPLSGIAVKPYSPIELPPLMDGPPMPISHKLPSILSAASSALPASFTAQNMSMDRPSLPPLSSLTTGLATSASSPNASLAPAGMQHNGSNHNISSHSSNLSITPTTPHVPLTPSHSGGRDYFPPVPTTSGAASNATVVTATSSTAANTTNPNDSNASMLSTMVILLTFMDLRVVRVSDESLSMLGHHPMLFANKSLSELLHRTDRPKLAVLREWLRWVICSASGLSDVHLTRFPGNVTAPVFQRSPGELTAPAQDWPAHIIIEDNVHFRVLDGEYRQFRIRLYVGGPGVRVGHAETWENACVVCEVRRHSTPSDATLPTAGPEDSATGQPSDSTNSNTTGLAMSNGQTD
ncbi:hypothetical protein BDF19DRAFT_416493 [Syncephalis fuscata]|nr:hypothetical protein BDF19DRAFT_416493 [Syncephalis fuscata]